MPSFIIAPILKEIRNYSAQEWELFVEEWARGLENRYTEVKRLGNPGDLGRDVIGFLDKQKLEGSWDLYSCKHYEKPLQPSIAGIEIAKIIYHSLSGYSPPRHMYFASPRDVSTELADLLASPQKLKAYILQHWNSGYANRVTDTETILLEGKLKAHAENFDYSIFSWYQTSEMITDHRTTAHWAHRFGGLLPPPPNAVVPLEVAPTENVYVRELLIVYGEQEQCDFGHCSELAAHPTWQDDFNRQRERFYQAEAFSRAYRDETPPGTVENFVDDIHSAIDPIIKQTHPHGYDRLNRCLAQAAAVHAGGILAQHARPKVKQGVCHQLANSSKVRWVPR
jgi:hypothetical protein